MTNDTPQGQQPQPHHQQQEQHQQDFKQKLEALYNQSKSWFDRQQQNLDNLEAHQHNINQASLESVANIKANLQLTRNDVAFLRINIRTQDERIEELRTLIEKNKQHLAVQSDTIAHLKQERASLISSKRTLYQRTEELEANLAGIILRVEALERQLSRLKRHVREDKVAPGRNKATTTSEEDRRAKEIQRILSTIHGYEAVHAYALELLPPPSPDPLQDPSSQDPSYQYQATTPRSHPSPQSQPTIYLIADTPHEKPSPASLNIPAPISTSSTIPPLPFTFIPTTFNPSNPFFLTTSPPPSPPPPSPPSITATKTTALASTATKTTTAAGNTPNEIVTPASDIETLPFQNPHSQQPSPPPQPQFSPEKLLRLQRVHPQNGGHEAWMNQHNEQSQFLFQQFPHQDQWPRILRHPFTTSPQYARALVSLALSLWVSFLAYITIHIYSYILQPNQQYRQLEDPARVCETTYNTNSMSWMPLEGEFFIPT
ncbi:hypothetical protein K457DRAFT_15113 [Linnemannia elongata AG-77]|uniref:Uncharacterized protein n=1 Tax=Linnemannia elongata AG-77 TaxID=1314771 RepID=A0A197K897_9FUNG|nr:hypothetical protein K457DRAFT_15113 [Linnemannia elongata AG-77]